MRRTAIGGGQYPPSMKGLRNINELINQYENVPRYSVPMQLSTTHGVEVRMQRPWQSHYPVAPSLSSLTDSEFYSDSDAAPQITQRMQSPIYEDVSNAVDNKVIYNLSVVGRFLEMLQRLPLPRMSLTATGICFLVAIFLSPRPCAQSIIFPAFRLTFGTLYPAYASYKAVRTKNVKEYVKWMMYWIVYAFFNCTETFTDIFLSWFPFYYEVKVIIVIWLLSPATKGSSTLYRKFVHPMLTRREQEIDEYLNQAKERGYSAVLQLGSKGVNYATNVIMQTALKGGGNLVQTIRRSYSLSDLSEPDVHRTQDEIDEITRPQQRILRPRNPAARSASGSRHSTGMYFSEVDVASKNPTDFTNYNIRSSEDISSGYSSAEPISGGLSRTSSMTNATRARFKARKAEAENEMYRQYEPHFENENCFGQVPNSRMVAQEMYNQWRDQSFLENEQYFQSKMPTNNSTPLRGPPANRLSDLLNDDFKKYLERRGLSYSEDAERLEFMKWLENEWREAEKLEEEETNNMYKSLVDTWYEEPSKEETPKESMKEFENVLNIKGFDENKSKDVLPSSAKLPNVVDIEPVESDDEFLDAIPDEFTESKVGPKATSYETSSENKSADDQTADGKNNDATVYQGVEVKNSIQFTGQTEITIIPDQSNTKPTTPLMGPKALKESLEEIQNSFRTAIQSPPRKVTTSSYEYTMNPPRSENVLRKSPSHSKGKAPPPPTQTSDSIPMTPPSASTSRSASPIPEKAASKKGGFLKTYLPSIFRSEPKAQAKIIDQQADAPSSSMSNEYPRETEI